MITPTGKGRDPSAPKLLLVCSSGGHLLQLYSLLEPLWREYDRAWVTFDKSDARSLLAGERTYWGHFPTNRNVRNLFRNALLSWRVLRKERPHCVVSTGAGIGVPFLLLGRILGLRTIYIESFARKDNLSLTGRLLYPFVHKFFVQSQPLEQRYDRAVFRGTIY